jgi:hypothetical protein
MASAYSRRERSRSVSSKRRMKAAAAPAREVGVEKRSARVADVDQARGRWREADDDGHQASLACRREAAQRGTRSHHPQRDRLTATTGANLSTI